MGLRKIKFKETNQQVIMYFKISAIKDIPSIG